MTCYKLTCDMQEQAVIKSRMKSVDALLLMNKSLIQQ